MDFGAIYSQIEEKWYGLLDAIDEKGLPIYKVIDPIENAGIPSLPLTAGVLLVIAAVAFYTLSSGGIIGPQGGFPVNVMDSNGQVVEGANVAIILDAESLFEAATNSKGQAFFDLDANARYQAEVTTDNCKQAVELIDTSEMDSLDITLECTSPELAGCSGLTTDKHLTQLTDDQNNVPSACALRVYDAEDNAIDTPFTVSSSGLLDISKAGSCPADDSRVLIDCQYHKWEGTVAGLYNELDLYGQLTLAVKDDVKPDTGVLPPVEVKRDIYVKVQNTAGTPLENIAVKAVDASGNPLTVLFDGVTLESATDATGMAKLVMPDQQGFNINLNDPNGAYLPYTSASTYTATLTQSQTPITLNLATGFETKVYIKEEARQTAISGATVTISTDGRVISTGTTGSDGVYKATLLKGVQYRVEASHPLYSAASAEIAGGSSQSIFLKPIDETKAGTAVVDVMSATGLKENFPSVRVQLYSDSNNTLWMTCITPADGRCVFNKVSQGTYHLAATPPGAVSAQTFAPFQVSPLNTTTQSISVTPNSLVLTVLTQVQMDEVTARKMNVEVALWNADYDEAVDSKKSDSTRKVTFNIDQGTRYFLVAEYVDPTTGTKYGPLKTSPAVMIQSKKITLTLTRVTEEVSVETPMEIARGTEAKVKLKLSLPEYRPNKMYDSAYVEMFIGDAGGVQDIRRTPVVIQPIYLSDLASQDPFVASVDKADEYQYQATPKKEDNGESKYIRVNIGKYTTPTVYQVEIPVYARELATNGDTKISYRAAWKTGATEVTSNSGLWSEATLRVVGDIAPAKELESGDFYSYNSYFSKQFNGSAVAAPQISEGAAFYLHIIAKARQPAQSWTVDINNLPDKAEGVSYTGTITRADGQVVSIAEFPITGSDFSVKNSEAAYQLEKDDTLSLTVTLRGKERGKATLTLFGDYDNSMSYEITRKARTGATPIAGVTATLVTSSNFCIPGYDNGLSSSDSCYFDYDGNLTLPTNAKKFRISLELAGTATANVLVEAADSSIKFDETQANYYEAEMKAPKAITIDGYGSSQVQNLMKVYIWEKGTTQPTTPWASIIYGPADYSMTVTPFSAGAVEPAVSEATTELQIKMTRTEGTTGKIVGADVLTDNQAKVSAGSNNGMATLVLGTEPYFQFKVDPTLPLKAKDGVTVTAKSPLFGKLVQDSEVSGLIFEPEYPQLLFTKPLALGQAMSETVKITSSWKEPVGIKLSPLVREGYDIRTSVRTYSSSNVPLETFAAADLSKEVQIPAEGRAEVVIAATATTAGCRLDLEPTILGITVSKLTQAAHYTLGLTCIVEGMGEYTMPDIADWVARESLSPDRITMDSCSTDSNGTYAYVCDTEQLSVAIAKSADSLLQRPTAIDDVRFYAFGQDEFSAAIMDQAVKDHNKDNAIGKIAQVFDKAPAAMQSATNDIVLFNKPSCGILQVSFAKIHADEDVNVSFNVITDGATWCEKSEPHYTIGLMNFDKKLRPDFGWYVSLAGDSQKFFDAIAKAREQGNQLDASLLFGYEPENTKDRAGAEAASVFTYRECERKASGDCPSFAVKTMTDARPVIGYYHVTDQGDILVGMVYDENQVVGAGGAYTQIPAYRAIFAARLMEYATKGTMSSGWIRPSPNFQMTYSPMQDPDAKTIIDLTGPEIVEGSFKMYGFNPYSTDNTPSYELVGNRSVNIELQATGTPAFCILSNLDAGGKGVDEVKSAEFREATDNTDTLTLAIPWTLSEGSGTKYVSAFCVDANGIPSHKVRAKITLDDSTISLVRPLPTMLTTHAPVTTVPQSLTNYIYLRDRFSDIKYCELRPMAGAMPNVEICDDNGDGVFDTTNDGKDNNANADLSGKIPGTNVYGYQDGCCVVTKLDPDFYYNNAKIQCWTPFITKDDAATDFELFCRDSSGNEAGLGKISVWKYSNDAPDFSVPDDFIMSTGVSDNPTEYRYWFNLDGVAANAPGPISWGGDYELMGNSIVSADHIKFDYSFTVYDIDGIDPASGCSVGVEAYTASPTGAIDESSRTTVQAATTSCTGTPTEPGSMREVRMKCPMTLLNNSVNNVTVHCDDIPKIGSATSSFKITLDETGPVLSKFNMDPYGAMLTDFEKGTYRDMAPTITFQVDDRYSAIAGCWVNLKLKSAADDKLSYACQLEDTESTLPNSMKAVCNYNASAGEHVWPVFIMDLKDPKVLSFDCYDEVMNPNDPAKDFSGQANQVKIKGMSDDDFKDLVVKACELVRFDSSHEEILKAGFYDLGAEGSVAVDDGQITSTYDSAGVQTYVVLQDMVPKTTLKNALDAFSRRDDTKISRLSIDCASGGICQTLIQAVIYGLTAKCTAETSGTGAAACERTAQQTTKEGAEGVEKTGRTAAQEGTEATAKTTTKEGTAITQDSIDALKAEGKISAKQAEELGAQVTKVSELGTKADDAVAEIKTAGEGLTENKAILNNAKNGLARNQDSLTQAKQELKYADEAWANAQYGDDLAKLDADVTAANAKITKLTGKVERGQTFVTGAEKTVTDGETALKALQDEQLVTGMQLKGEQKLLKQGIEEAMSGTKVQWTESGSLLMRQSQEAAKPSWYSQLLKGRPIATGKGYVTKAVKGWWNLGVFSNIWTTGRLVRAAPTGGAMLGTYFATALPWTIFRGAIALGASEYNQANDWSKTYDVGSCTLTDSGWWSETGVTALGIINPTLELLRVGMPDEFQANLCAHDTLEGGGTTYILSARADRIDMGAAGGIASGFSVCFDSCNNFVCDVTIYKDTGQVVNG